MPRLLLSVVLIALCLPSSAPSQVDSTARLMGSAKSAFNGRPLAGVMIAVPDAHKFVVTDSSGTFFLAGLPVGKQKVFVAYNGRGSEEYQFVFKHGKTKRVAVVLDIEAVDLDPIVVEAQGRGSWMDLAGFFDRRKAYGGFARFYTREDLAARRARTIEDVLRREGIYPRCFEFGCVPARSYRGDMCAVPIFVDGMRFYANDYEVVPIDRVAGVEVYRPGMEPIGTLPTALPVLARDFRNPRQGVSCGRIDIWTR